MAKKKLSARERKARKRKSYIRSEYYKNFDALEYLRNFMEIKDVQIPTKITKKSLESVRKIYKEARSKAPTTDGYYIDYTTGEILTKLPTKEQMVREIRSEPTQQYRRYRAEAEEAPTDFDPNRQYIEDMKAKIRNLWLTREIAADLKPLRDSGKTEANYQKNVVPKFEEAQQRLLGAIDYSVATYGEEVVANALAGNVFVQKIANLDEKYTHEIVESIDDDIIPLIEASVKDAIPI